MICFIPATDFGSAVVRRPSRVDDMLRSVDDMLRPGAHLCFGGRLIRGNNNTRVCVVIIKP